MDNINLELKGRIDDLDGDDLADLYKYMTGFEARCLISGADNEAVIQVDYPDGTLDCEIP
jgi:hypothetical protein